MLLVNMILINIKLLEYELVVYGYDQSSDSNSIAYRGFGYYQHGVELNQPLRSYFPNYDHQVNHLSQHIHVMNNSFNHILIIQIIVPICMLVVRLMMIMILSPLSFNMVLIDIFDDILLKRCYV